MKRVHNKAHIIAEGERLFRTQGYHNTGINDVLKACKIPKGSFYNYFVSKEDFAIQVVEFYGAYYKEQLEASLEKKHLSPFERLKLLYLVNTVEFYKSEGFTNGCLVGNLSTEVGGLSSMLAETLATQFNDWISYIAETIEEGQAKGVIVKKADPTQLAQYLHGNLFGALAQMKIERSIDPVVNAMETSLNCIKK